VRRYRRNGCGHVWRQNTNKAASRAKLSRAGLGWALEGIVCQHMSVARVAEGFGVAWNTVNDAVLAGGKRVLIADTTRFEGVAVIGVDEHVWRHTRRGDKYVTVIIDLTPIREGAVPARLLNMVEGRSNGMLRSSLLLVPIWAGRHLPLILVLKSYRDPEPRPCPGFLISLACGFTILARHCVSLFQHVVFAAA